MIWAQKGTLKPLEASGDFVFADTDMLRWGRAGKRVSGARERRPPAERVSSTAAA
ncbi:hypothetical protein GCM10010145_52320 [Streptomyces ruber]|uniref:Uncharacterized protein n=2 Tax=Streptomyces TaxID=1883 RepID=A0A918EW11_9ACTN|nr:hypothetical protein GCM10010145_52320 [Streptomyces ruber]